MPTTVIRAECDKIDQQIAAKDAEIVALHLRVAELDAEIVDLKADLETRGQTIVSQAEEIDLLKARIAELEAEVLRLQDLLDDCKQADETIVMLEAASIPLDVAPVVGQPFEATPSAWQGGGGVVETVHNWWINVTFLSGGHVNPFVPVAPGHIGKTLEYEEVTTFANGETRKVRTEKSLPVLAQEEPAPDPIPDPEPTPVGAAINVDTFYKPEATGDGSGSSPENCAPISALAANIAASGPGKTHGLLATAEVWPSFGMSLTVGGAPGAPVTIIGVGEDRVPKLVTLSSGRPKLNEAYYDACNAIDPNGSWGPVEISGGATLLNMGTGADHIAVKFIELRNYKYLISVNRTIADLAVEDILLRNVKEGIWMDNDIDPGHLLKRAINKLRAKRLRMYGFEIGMRLLGTTNDVEILGVEMDSRRVQGHIPFGFTIGKGDTDRSDTVNNVTIIADAFGMSGVIKNFHDTNYQKPWKVLNPDGTHKSLSYAPVDSNGFEPVSGLEVVPNPDIKSSYWNGDAISTERTCHTITLEGITASGCCDAGYDLKSLNTIVRRCIGQDNKKNFRPRGTTSEEFPQGQLFEDCVSISARKRGGNSNPEHMGIAGNTSSGKRPAVVAFKRCHFTGGPSKAFSTDADHKWGIQMTAENCTTDGPDLTPVPFVA